MCTYSNRLECTSCHNTGVFSVFTGTFYGSRINVASGNAYFYICPDLCGFFFADFLCTVCIKKRKVFKGKAPSKARCNIKCIKCCFYCNCTGAAERIMQRCFSSPHHFLEQGSSKGFAQRCNSAVCTVAAFVQRKPRQIKQNKNFVFVYVYAYVALFTAFGHCYHVPHITALRINCFMHHSLNAVFGIEL